MLLKIENLKKTYSRGDQIVEALRGVSLEIQAGQFVSIMGPSGSGKSTLLHLMGGLDRPTSGKVLLQDQAIDSLNDHDLSFLDLLVYKLFLKYLDLTYVHKWFCPRRGFQILLFLLCS